MVDHVTASRSKSGEIFLFDSKDDFTASYINGQWFKEQEFEFWQLDEFFSDITDDTEVLRVLAEARSALS